MLQSPFSDMMVSMRIWCRDRAFQMALLLSAWTKFICGTAQCQRTIDSFTIYVHHERDCIFSGSKHDIFLIAKKKVR